jgi:hypothetical protein
MTLPETRYELFLFLALPKELRLVVYEFLIELITTTYHKHDRSPPSEYIENHLAEKGQDPVPSIAIIYEAVSVTVLATNHEIYSEAVEVIKPVPEALCWRPKKSIVNILGIIRLVEFLMELKYGTCALTKDIRPESTTRKYLPARARYKKEDPLASGDKYRRILIAIENNSPVTRSVDT